MSDNHNPVGGFEKFQYPDPYYKYHRNSILFFSIVILITLLGVKVDLSGLAFVKDGSDTFNKLVPVILYICGIYCAAMFRSEWNDCARHHRLHIENVDKKIIDSCNEFSKNVNDLRSDFDRKFQVAYDIDDYLKKVFNVAVSSKLYQEFLEEVERVPGLYNVDGNYYFAAVDDNLIDSIVHIISTEEEIVVNGDKLYSLDIREKISQVINDRFGGNQLTMQHLNLAILNMQAKRDSGIEKYQSEMLVIERYFEKLADNDEYFNKKFEEMRNILRDVNGVTANLKREVRKSTFLTRIKTDYGATWVIYALMTISTVGLFLLYSGVL